MKKLLLTIVFIIIILAGGLAYLNTFTSNPNPTPYIEGWNVLKGRNFSFSYPSYLMVEEMVYDNPRESYSIHNDKLTDTMKEASNNDLVYIKVMLSNEKDTGFLEDFTYQYWTFQTYPNGGPEGSSKAWSKPEKLENTNYLVVKRTGFIFYPPQKDGSEPLMSEDIHYFVKLDDDNYIHMIVAVDAGYNGEPSKDQLKADIENIAKSIRPL